MSATPRLDPRAGAVDYDPFAQAPLARVVPSTEAQREVWLAAKLDDATSLAYNESISLRLRGALDADALRRALQALLDRHEALRATFSPDGRDLCIAEHTELPWQSRDLGALDADARAAEVAATLQRVVETPFDLERGPLVTAELLRVGADDHLLVLNTHHLVCDGWSFGVIARELAALYAAERSGEPARLPAADSFAEFALAEARHPDSEAFRDDERYWLAHYAQVPAPLELPLDRPRPRRRTTSSRRIDHVLDASLVGDLRQTGARHGASLYATLLAGFAALLQRLTGEDELVIGIPAAGQAAGGHHALVGHAVNVLPLRVTLDPAAPFADELERLRGDLLDAFEHQRYTFGTLLKRLALARDPARLPLVSVLFNLDQALDEDTLRFADLRFELAGVPRRFENFELFVNAVQVAGAVRLECQYNTDLFEAATIARWLDAYATLLRAAADDPQQAVAALPLLSAAGLAELEALQPPPTPFDAGARIEAEFFAQAARTPERPAVRCGDTRWSYAQLAARAERIAAAVRARGLGDGALVGIALERGPDMVAALLGVLRAGAGYVPLDPAFPRERLAFMAADAQLALLVTQTALADTIAGPHTLLLDGDAGLPAAEPAAAAAAGGDAVAYVIYTSGSTGTPKGVRVPHRAVVNFLASMRRTPGLAADDRLLAVTTLSFDIAVLELLLPLGVGAEVVLATREQAADGFALAALLASSVASVMQATPATWRLLLEAGWRGGAGFRALCGGEALTPDLAAALLERCGALWNLYGPTETTVWSTCAEITSAAGAIPIGRPIDNTTVWVLDAAHRPCPVGVPGELAIGGAGVTLGYLDRPELTADRFIADPFGAPGARLYRTGDRGRWRNDGTLEHLGRLDFQVKLRGYRIELGEIEARLAEHADVARTVVRVREDRAGDQRLVAYVTARAGAAIDEAALRRHLRATLPDYMLPQHFVVLDALPLLPNGKLDRKALPPPSAPVIPARPVPVAPRTDAERRIAAAMEETLCLPGIGVDDDFFALGGHSLLAAQLTARLNREFGVALSLRALFDAPTVAGVAAAIADAGPGAAPAIARRTAQERAPLSLLQKRLWLFEQLSPGTVVYNTPSAHRLRGRLDEAAFERAFNEIVRRQSALRTSIGHEDGEVVQVIHDEVAVTLFPAEDLSALPPAEREAELARRLQALTDTPFDLTRAPLFRVRMYRLADDEHALFFMPHHIVWDGWSFDLFYTEIAALYAAFQHGQPSPLPALPVAYGDFAAWHGEWLRGPAYAAQFDHQLAVWRERFATRGAPRPLPTDRPRGPAMAGAAETEWLALPKARAEALRELARDADATVFMLMLAAYYALLYRTIGDGHLVVGTPVRVRSAPELEPLMGLFTNLLPLPLDLDPASGFLDLVAQVKRTLLEGLAHADVQLEDLMHEPGMREAAGTTHFYQAQFSYQDARQRIRDWGGLAQEQILLFQRGASEDLAMWFLEHGDGMTGGVLYNADLLDAATVQRLARDYLALLDGVLADPRQSIARLVGGSDDDLERIRRWNTPAVEAPATSLAARFEAAMDRAPDAAALLYGSWSTRYRELEQQANRIAACLRRRGAGAGSVVALAADAGTGRIAGLLAILKAGAICVPLEPRDPPARLRRLLADAAPALLIGDSRLHDVLGWPHAQALWLDTGAAEIVTADAARTPTGVPDADVPALAVYTSGADGTPRATAFSHRFVGALLDQLQRTLGLGHGERILGTAAPDTGQALLECLLALSGGHAFVQANRDAARDGAALAHDIATSGASVVLASADGWRRLVGAAAAPPAYPFRAVCVDGTPPAALAERVRDHCGAGFWNALATETALLASCGRVDTPAGGIDAGAPLRVTPLWVVDRAGQPLPVGAIGEIVIGAGGTAFGREATRLKSAATTTVFGDELVRSGWRGRWHADGRIEELGRLDRRLLIDGCAVEPAAIEALLQAQAGVERALVRAQADASGNTHLLAYALMPGGGTPADTLRLRAALEANLPAAALPTRLFALAQWPMRADGSIDSAALPTQSDDAGVEAPVTPAEQLLAGLWRELLGVPRIARDDNFFDLGGHSLLAMTMVARVEKLTRVRLNLLKVANGSLRALATELPDAAVASAAARGTATLGGRLRDLLGLGRRGPHA